MIKDETIKGYLMEEIRLDDEPETHPDVSGKPEKSKFNMKLVMLCGMLAVLFIGWAGYTLFEVVVKSRNEEESSGVARLLNRPLSRPQCGKTKCLDCKWRVRRIVGGLDAKPGNWPWMAEVNVNNQFVCGGVLVNEEYVLTAAHCLHRRGDFFDTENVKIILGVVHLKPSGSTSHVFDLIIHEDYNPLTLENDIALIRLREPVIFTQHLLPVFLPNFVENTTGVMLGWGKEQVRGKLSPTLKKVTVPLVDNGKCQQHNNEIFRRIKVFPKMHLCVGYGKKSPKYACAGDSGGGFFQKSFGRWFVKGVVSWIDPSCNATFRDSYTVLSNVVYHRRWIDDNINDRLID